MHLAECILQSASCKVYLAKCILQSASYKVHIAKCILQSASCKVHLYVSWLQTNKLVLKLWNLLRTDGRTYVRTGGLSCKVHLTKCILQGASFKMHLSPPFQIRMTNLGHPDLVSMTSRGHPNLVSMTSLALCNRHEEFLKKSKKVWKQFFSKFSPYLLWSWGGFTSYISRCLGSVGSLLMAFMIKISIFRAIFLRKSTKSEKKIRLTVFMSTQW